jgi:hypothetical protein
VESAYFNVYKRPSKLQILAPQEEIRVPSKVKSFKVDVLYGYSSDFQSIDFARANVMIYDSIYDILYDVN